MEPDAHVALGERRIALLECFLEWVDGSGSMAG
jgi:hypothetical protein